VRLPGKMTEFVEIKMVVSNCCSCPLCVVSKWSCWCTVLARDVVESGIDKDCPYERTEMANSSSQKRG